MVYTTLDIAPMPSRCGRTPQRPVRHYPWQSIGTPIGKTDSVGVKDSLTSYIQAPVPAGEYDSSSAGSSGVFIVMAALYICFCMVRKYKRSRA